MAILSVFACAVVHYTCKTAFQERPGRAKRTHLIVLAAVWAGVIGAALALEVLLEGVVLFHAPLYAAVAAALACLGGGYALWWAESALLRHGYPLCALRAPAVCRCRAAKNGRPKAFPRVCRFSVLFIPGILPFPPQQFPGQRPRAASSRQTPLPVSSRSRP